MDAVASHCEVLRPVGRDGLEMAGRDSAAMLKRRPEPAGAGSPRAVRPGILLRPDTNRNGAGHGQGSKTGRRRHPVPSRFASQLNVFDIWNGRGILLVGHSPNRINAY